MLSLLSRRWWLIGLRGLFALVFGILAFVWPGITLVALVLLFAAYVLVDGALAIFTAIGSRDVGRPRWLLWLEGIAGIVAGVLTIVWPGITALVLLGLVAAWAVVTGVFEIVAAIRLRREIEGEWLLVLSGIASAVFGLALILWPGAGALAMVWLIAAYAVVFGVLLIALAFKLRGWSQRSGRPVATRSSTSLHLLEHTCSTLRMPV